MQPHDLKYARLLGRLYNAPLMLLPDKAEALHQAMAAALAGGLAWRSEASSGGRSGTGEQPARKPYSVVGKGVALIPVFGPLVQRGGWLDALCGMSSYDRTASLVDQAMNDPEVNAVLLEIDSPGGEVAGLFALTDRLKAMGQRKPIWSYANEGAFSAGYAIPCATERIYLPRTGMVGSVGVIAMHVDQSQRDAAQGYVYTPIFAGERKAAGSPHAPLDDATRGSMQREIDRIYGMFVDHVATGRQLDRQVVIDTQAGLLNADDAVAGRFADGIASLDDVVSMLSDAASPRITVSMKGNPVPQLAETEGSNAQFVAGASLTDIAADAKAAERTRIAAILDLPQAQGREALARKLALTTDMDAAAAAGLLDVTPQASAAATAPANPFVSAMQALGNPLVGAGGQAEQDPAQTAASLGAAIAALA